MAKHLILIILKLYYDCLNPFVTHSEFDETDQQEK